MSRPLIAIPTCRPYGTWMVCWMIRATNIPSLRDVFAVRVFFNDTFRACFEWNVPRVSLTDIPPRGDLDVEPVDRDSDLSSLRDLDGKLDDSSYQHSVPTGRFCVSRIF